MEEMKFDVKGGTNTKIEKNKDLGFWIIFGIISALLVPFSAYATYTGYLGSAGTYMAIILAAVTGLLFFAINYMVSDHRRNGKPHLKLVFLFIIPLTISFFGNFAYFYGNEVQVSDLRESLTEYSKTLSNTYNTSIAELDKHTGIEALNKFRDDNIRDLEFQSTLPIPGSFGRECRKIYGKIEDFLKINYSVDLTKRYKGTPTSKKLDEAKDNINNAINTIITTKTTKINRTKNPIENLFLPLETKSKSFLKAENEDSLKRSGCDLLNDIKKNHDDIVSKTSTIIPSYTADTLDVPICVNSSNPMESIEHAWKNKNTSLAPAKNLLFCLIIDLLILICILVIIPYNRKGQRRKGNTGINTLN